MHNYYLRMKATYPELLLTIVSTLYATYAEVRNMLGIERMRNSYFKEHYGQILYPCVQMRIDEALQPLRQEGILVIGAPNASHNCSHVEINLSWAVLTVHFVALGERKPRDNVYLNRLTAGQLGFDHLLPNATKQNMVHLAIIHKRTPHTLNLEDIRLVSMSDYVDSEGVLDMSLKNEAIPVESISVEPCVKVREELIKPKQFLRLK